MSDQPQFEVFYDGDCPLCRREIDFLRRRDRQHRIRYTDIAADTFDASLYGLRRDDFMAQIRGRLADGTMISGVEVFRQLYSAVGFGWLVWMTRTPGVSWLLDRAYAWFAKNRLRLTGRCEGDQCSVPNAGDRDPESAAAAQ